MILATRVEVRALAGSKAMRASRPSEQLGEEVREIGCLARRKAVAGELEAGVPVGRWAKVLARLIAAPQLVIGGTLFRVREHSVGLVEFLHARFGIRFLGNVRVVFARQFPKSLLDLVGRGLAGHPQNLVVVLEFHARSSIHCGY